MFERLMRADVARCFSWVDGPSGLRALTVVDEVVGGLAAGGIRTQRYANFDEAFKDAAQLARAMTMKCALAGLPAGGCKTVVIEHPGLRRQDAFEVLGKRLGELGGLIRTAGDLGTREEDLRAVHKHHRHVHLDESRLAASVARGIVRCIEACALMRHGQARLPELRIAVQGSGAIGAAVAKALCEEGAQVWVSDIVDERARLLAQSLGCEVLAPGQTLSAEVDVISPCAVGGVLDRKAVAALRAWAVVGAANNVLAHEDVAATLQERGVLFVPDIIASAGAVIDGIGRSVMQLDDRRALIDRLGKTALSILVQASGSGSNPLIIARQRAAEALAQRATSSTLT